MAKKRDCYRCSACGSQTFQWLGQCPGCHEWNTLELVSAQSPSKAVASSSSDVPLSLAEIEDNSWLPFSSGMADLDRVLGGGIMPGSAILVGGEPGIGKSTLLLQVCLGVAAQGKKALYASGEESLSQIKSRAERLGDIPGNLTGMATANVENIVAALEKSAPALLIADSVQTLQSSETEGLPGNVNQTRAVATILVDACKRLNCALILVGHVTKDGSLAGPRLLEHLVDTVVSLEGDRRQMFRLLRVFKNRFGPNEELLVFRMENRGLKLIDDPSTFFLEDRDPGLSGAALVMAAEGQRPIAVEAQALVARSWLAIPRRTALGFDVNRLHLLLAVLEKKLKLNFGQADIYAKVGGGMRLQDPGLDLALVAAILSSYYDVPLPEKSIFWGEVDLNGQIRPVSANHLRLAQAKKLGFDPIFCPFANSGKDGVMSLSEMQKKLFKRK